MVAEDALAFAGIAPPILRVYPVETHVAEKLRSYTMPRARPNSRVKDLPDFVLIATVGSVEASQLRAAIDQTFDFRGTHGVPDTSPRRPPRGMAPTPPSRRKTSSSGPRSAEAYQAAQAFLDPVLVDLSESRWDPDSWSWTGGSE